MKAEEFIDSKIRNGFLNEDYTEDGITIVKSEYSYLCELFEEFLQLNQQIEFDGLVLNEKTGKWNPAQDLDPLYEKS